MGSLEGVVSGMYWNKCLKVNAYSENRSRKPEARGLKLPGTAFAGFALFTLLRHLFSCRFPNKTAQVLSILLYFKRDEQLGAGLPIVRLYRFSFVLRGIGIAAPAYNNKGGEVA